jgi:hypothetical protein
MVYAAWSLVLVLDLLLKAAASWVAAIHGIAPANIHQTQAGLVTASVKETHAMLNGLQCMLLHKLPCVGQYCAVRVCTC